MCIPHGSCIKGQNNILIPSVKDSFRCKNLIISKVVISATDILKTVMLAQMLDTDKKKEIRVTILL
jgi:hypothetical protein